MSDFLQMVTEAFQPIIARGQLTVIWDGYDPVAFDNAAVVLTGTNARIRMVRDRGDISAEVASVGYPEDWNSLERALRAIGVSDAPAEGLLTPEEAASIVEKHLAALEDGFSPSRIEHTRTKLAVLDAEALKRFLDPPPTDRTDQ